MQHTQTSSIKKYSVKYTIIIFVVIFFVTVFHYIAYSQYLTGIQENEYKKSLAHTANNISRTVDFYQSFVDKVASQTVVVDLLQFGTSVEIQAWANNMQRLVPESIGLTLFDSAGQIKGLKGEFRLSESCLFDMDSRFKNLPVSKPPVHYRIEELAHFDIVSPVISDGDNIGLVFVSFSLDTIRRFLDDVNNENQHLKITTSEGVEIASAGSVYGYDNDVYIIKQKIEHTDWLIELSVVDVEKNVLVTSLLISSVLAFILLSLTLYVSMKRLFKIVVTDFEALSWIMSSIKEGTYDPKSTKKVSLSEAEHVMRFIHYTARELHAHQEKLKQDGTTDELTGLYNRRILNSEIDSCLQMANQGEKLYVVILDLDYFKEINDSHGHDVGDDILRVLSEGLIKQSNSSDICTRSGGDEFIVVLMDYTEEQVVEWYRAVVTYVDNEISKYCAAKHIQLKFGVSAGCTLIKVNDIKSSVLKRADEALYKVKGKGKGSIEFS